MDKEFVKRRKKFFKKLRPNSITLLSSATLQKRSNDTAYPFRQDSNFYYLSGFNEDNSAMVIIKTTSTIKSFFFLEPKDPQKELWDGKRMGVKKAQKRLGFDNVYPCTKFEKILQKLLKKHYFEFVYYPFEKQDIFIEKFLQQTKKIATQKDVAPIIYKMRLIKSPWEIKRIKKAIAITTKAHIHAMKIKKEHMYEYQLQAEFEYIFKKNGAYSDAYTTIVAGGNNANTLHYIKNNKKLKPSSLVLIDAGCEYQYYASDITRTIPISGKFTKAQKEVYQAVLDVQKEIISMIKPGVLRSQLQSKAQELLTKALIRLKILNGDYKKLLKQKKFFRYYPHGIGHYMGLDVHDQNPYVTKQNKEIPLSTGMILTIEPGLYLPKDDPLIPKEYRGIGIRIEDDILITKDGYENLSKAIPKEIADIEGVYN